MSASVPCSKELPIIIAHCFFLMVLHGLVSDGTDPLLGGTCDSSSTSRMVNLFCSCKLLGGAGALLLVPAVIRFHPLPAPEVALTQILSVDTACISIAVGVQGSLG